MRIPLTRGKFAEVDDSDYEELSQHSWYALPMGRTYYAVRRRKVDDPVGPHLVYMHRHLLPGLHEVDHKDRNGLNNCRYNLRESCRSDNGANQRVDRTNNRSGFKGVCKVSPSQNSTNQYRSQITVRGKRIYLGYFKTSLQAAQAYNAAALEHFGEHANLNQL